MSFPVLLAAAGLVPVALSLRAPLVPAAPAKPLDPEHLPAAAIAFPGLIPAIAVSVPLTFAAPFPWWETTLGILAPGVWPIAVNWLLMLWAKPILGAIGPVPLQRFGAAFGMLLVSSDSSSTRWRCSRPCPPSDRGGAPRPGRSASTGPRPGAASTARCAVRFGAGSGRHR